MRFLLPLLLVLPIAACLAPPEAEDPPLSPSQSELYQPMGTEWLWPNGEVPVCFANVNPAEAYPKMLRNEIESKWGRYGNLRFTGWGTCAADPGNVIRINNQASHLNPRSFVGRQAPGVPTDMFLNFSRWTGCESFLWIGASDDECFRYVGMHEFGHALGFLHEQDRTDTPGSCNADGARTGGGVENPFLTAYDKDSVMNYCNKNWNNDGELSALDIIGLQKLYGRRMAGSMVGRGGRNLDVAFANPTPGTPVNIFENRSTTNQSWSYNVVDGTFRSIGMCLDDPSGNQTPGTQTHIQHCGSRQTQRWDFVDVVIRALGAKCLDRVAGGTANGTKVQLFYCTGNGNQRWTYTPSGELRTGPGGSAAKCLDTFSGGSGTQAFIHTCVGDDFQKFDLTELGEIRSRANGLCLDVAGFSKEDHTPIQLFACKSAGPDKLNQQFNFTADGKFRGSAGRCLDAWIPDISVNGIPAKINGCSSHRNQVWDYYFKP